MANHSIGGQTQRFDRAQQRIAAGTVGGEHTVPYGIAGSGVTGTIDDSDPRIEYGTFDGTTFTTIDQSTMVTNGQLSVGYAYDGPAGGTYHSLNTSGVACKFKFIGSQIGIMIGMHQNGAAFQVYIDGQLAKGRLSYFSPLATFATTVSATDTTIPVFNGDGLLSAAGEVCIGNEIISYASKDAYNLYGCTRGLYGTTAAEHQAQETVYSWANTPTADYSSNMYGSRRIPWSNHLLAPGEHEIIVVHNGTGTVDFDGFVISEIVSARNIRTFIDTWTWTGPTDANGFANIGPLNTLSPQDIVQIGYIGHTQTSPTTAAGASTLAKLAVRATGTSSLPYYYIHGGPPSTSVTIVVSVILVGGLSM